MPADLLKWAERRWLMLVLAGWLVACAIAIWLRWDAIYWFALADTDDNLRIMQVRALLAGQDWFDLRQYRLDPPGGADIHWSRVVDLPIAGLRLFFDLFTDGPSAERAAVGVAPLLPLGVAMVGVALTVRRLLGGTAFLLGVPLLFLAGTMLAQFLPTRIDHHGWQLAMLGLVVAGLVDPRGGRSGATVGLASALSLAIGLEFLPYLAAAGGIVALYWVWDADDTRQGTARRRLEVYGAALAGGSALGFAAFASTANRAPVCDALSPVWLSATVAGGALLVLLPRLGFGNRTARLIAAGLAATILAAAFALVWPRCLGKPEGVSDQLQYLWLSNVREVKPIWNQTRDVALGVLALPVVGVLGSALLVWTRRADPAAWPHAVAIAFLSAASLGLLFWQTRAGPGAQLLALPGATALVWILFPRLRAARSAAIRVVGPVLLLVVASGGIVPLVLKSLPAETPKKKAANAIGIANRRCPAILAFRPLNRLPAGTVFTFVDLSPRLIALTHHSAVAGPYHRNGAAITDVMLSFRGTADEARTRVAKHRADYLLICPNMSESTLYSSNAPRGFYVQLRDGRVPAWLTPVALPKGSPFKLWRVVRGSSRAAHR